MYICKQMNRNNFIKKACGIGIGSCVGFRLLSKGDLYAAAHDNQTESITPVVPVDTRQVQNVLSFVENSMSENVKKDIFERLGYEHTTDPGFINWIDGYKKNLKSFFDRVNSGEDRYWESMEYDPEKSAVKIVGKPVDKCACPYAQCPNPPESLCHYCCKNFQVAMFEMLFDKQVEVRIDEAFLLGDKRCSTTIFVDGKLQIDKI